MLKNAYGVMVGHKNVDGQHNLSWLSLPFDHNYDSDSPFPNRNRFDMHARSVLCWLLRMPGSIRNRQFVENLFGFWKFINGPLNRLAWRQTPYRSWPSMAWQRTWRHIGVPRYGDATTCRWNTWDVLPFTYTDHEACMHCRGHMKSEAFFNQYYSLALSCRPDLDLPTCTSPELSMTLHPT